MSNHNPQCKPEGCIPFESDGIWAKACDEARLSREEREFLLSELDTIYQQAKDHVNRFGYLNLQVRLVANRKCRIIKGIMEKLAKEETK